MVVLQVIYHLANAFFGSEDVSIYFDRVVNKLSDIILAMTTVATMLAIIYVSRFLAFSYQVGWEEFDVFNKIDTKDITVNFFNSLSLAHFGAFVSLILLSIFNHKVQVRSALQVFVFIIFIASLLLQLRLILLN